MKVKLLRDHLDNKKGDTIEVTPDREKYFKMVGLIADDTKEKRSTKPTKEKNSKAGPNPPKKKGK